MQSSAPCRLLALAWLTASLSACSAPAETHVETNATREDPYALRPEMIQLERDLASESYRAMVLGWTNYNDLNGEMNRADLPDSPDRFAAAHGGIDTVRSNPELARAYEARLAIEKAFLGLMEEAYERLGKSEMFASELARIEREREDSQEGSSSLPEAKPLAPILPAGAERQWPRWRGPSGQGLSDETGLPERWDRDTNIEWKTPIPGRGNSSPVIWDDQVFLTTAFEDGGRRSLISVARRSGDILWVRDAPSLPPEKKFIEKNSWASPTPIADGERVVAFLGNTGLVAFGFAGEVLWHYPMPWFDGTHGTGASPAFCGDAVVLVQEHNRGASIAVGVDRRSGSELWKLELDPALGWCSVLPLRVGDREEVIAGVHHRIVALDPATGRELWSANGPTREVVPTLVYGNGLVYSCSGRNGPTLAIRPGGDGDVTSTHVAWSVVRGAPHVPSPVLAGDLLYFTNDTGILTCLDAGNGETVYQKRLRGKFTASPVAADGKVYFTNESGDTFVVRQGREYELIAVNTLEEATLASIAVLDRRLYIRTEGHLYSIR